MLRSETRLGLTDEEAVEEWGRAGADLDAAAELFGPYTAATSQALWDARERSKGAICVLCGLHTNT